MSLQLVGISGECKGHCWPVSQAGLLLGRSSDCDVILTDASVSRRHCRVFWRDGKVWVEDLGSRNPPLVNGLLTKEGILRAKDEIAVGTDVFLLSDGVSDNPSRSFAEGEEAGTASWGDGPPVPASKEGAGGANDVRPRTVEDLLTLHEMACLFGQASTSEELLNTVAGCLRRRFRPQRLWVARVHGRDRLTFYSVESPAGDPAAGAPRSALNAALEQGRAMLTPETVRHGSATRHAFTLVAPVTFLKERLAVLALRTEPPHGTYQEADVRFLSLLAECLAPFVHAVETTEQLRRDYERLQTRTGDSQKLVGVSRAIGHVHALVDRAAKSELHVLVTGETGTGKELVARSIHARSSRHNKPLVVVNCAAIPRDLFESEIFGYEKGAFTGADKARPGLLAVAHGGTLFLDEVGDLSLDNQARILRVLEDGVFRRIGAQEETRVDIRVVAATNRDVDADMAKGRFREDLFHRLNGFRVHIPPLRQRPSDIPVLARHFLDMGKEHGKRPLSGISPQALNYLKSRSWPGNVRELRNVIMRAISQANQPTIELKDLGIEDALHPGQDPPPEPLSLRLIEKRHIAAVLEQCQGDAREAARVLGVSRSTLYRKLAAHGL
jgi:DNA-binding NtrC family response regulator